MRIFLDTETDTIITEEELRFNFESLQINEPDEYNYSFERYVINCTDKNGFLKDITDMLFVPVFDIWRQKTDIIKSIQNLQNYTKEEAEAYIEDSIEQGILYDVEEYKKHFAPYGN